ncbi:hypothetical protein OG874_00060 [Nocardia sp. NBC_00565]|uniref:hypothetical protein n=1 Tax=Nocardia sp. NBC_00565 TaxID=2975993 RepID=UPI002E819219|nr:hypothetical protein [Nocardia sp. NBC_00565]WUC03647.1 hypothetical protein OG874_00060 [Nocardia sp. NBC_00565]
MSSVVNFKQAEFSSSDIQVEWDPPTDVHTVWLGGQARVQLSPADAQTLLELLGASVTSALALRASLTAEVQS